MRSESLVRVPDLGSGLLRTGARQGPTLSVMAQGWAETLVNHVLVDKLLSAAPRETHDAVQKNLHGQQMCLTEKTEEKQSHSRRYPA